MKPSPNSCRKAHRQLLALVILGLHAGMRVQAAEDSNNAAPSTPNFEDYATIEAYSDGVPVYSLGNIAYIYGVSPDLYPGAVMQEGNTNPKIKIKPKKSWEIKRNLFVASMAQPGVRTMWNDNQPLLPIHLIDGDPDTAWCSYGSQVPDAHPEWIRVDLPRETEIESVVLVSSQRFALGNRRTVIYSTEKYDEGVLTDWMGFHRWAGRALPNELTIQVSRDAWHWDTVYENKGFSGNESGSTVIKFEPRLAKQILITGNNFKRYLDKYVGYAFSLGEVEVRNREGKNLALVSRGAGVTASSTSYLMSQDRFTHDLLYGPVQYDLGVKWTAFSADEGMQTWQYVEREKGKLEVDPAFDKLVTEMNRNGLRVILDIDAKANPIYKGRKLDWKQARIREISNSYYDAPGWAWQTEEIWKAYLRYVGFIAGHFKGRVAMYGLGADWPYREDAFKTVARIIKKIDPDVKFKGPDIRRWTATSGLPADTLDLASLMPDARMDAGAALDGLPKFFADAKQKTKELRGLGYEGVFSNGFLTWALYPPGPLPAGLPAWGSTRDENGFVDLRYTGDSEMVRAKTLAQSLVGTAGLGALSIFFNPYLNACSIGQSLFRSPVASQTITPLQPDPAYYVFRTLSTAFDNWSDAEFPVKFNGEKQFQTFTFRRGDNELMVAAWIPSVVNDGIVDAKCDVTLSGVRANEAWVIDVFNGTEQKLVLNREGSDTVLKDMRIKDYPTLIRLLRTAAAYGGPRRREGPGLRRYSERTSSTHRRLEG